MDESGDLGFGQKASKFFVVAYLILEEPWKLRNALTRLRKRLVGQARFSGDEFKFARDSGYVREKVLGTVRSHDLDLGVKVIDKQSVKDELKERPMRLYNYVMVHYMIPNITVYKPSAVRVVIDRSMSRKTREDFNRYLRNKFEWKFSAEKAEEAPQVEVVHQNSREEMCLQAADYVAGACFRKFEHNDSRYYEIIEHKIKFRNSWPKTVW